MLRAAHPLLALLALALLPACASAPPPPVDAPPAPASAAAAAPSASTTSTPPAAKPPAKATPTLKGTVDGKEFVVRGACATSGDGDAKRAGQVWLRIVNADLDPEQGCTRPERDDARAVRVTAGWKAGARTALDGQWTAITTPAAVCGGKTQTAKATGHVEALEAPRTKGGVGRVRVAIHAEKLDLEGELDVALFEDL